jgi:outer membrane protein assembly factor BamE (lipoprotein component of BamABCDE complex)
MRNIRNVVIFLIVIGLQGCATHEEQVTSDVNRASNFTPAPVTQVKWKNPRSWQNFEIGVTNEREILATLGQPTTKEFFVSRERWLYEGFVNGKYLFGYVTLWRDKIVHKFHKPKF